MSDVYGLILCGGSGMRLWPRSREGLPKQFLALCGPRTLLQDTVARMGRVVPLERLRVVTGGQWEALVAHQAREVAGELPSGFVVQEPCARDTAPAIVLGARALREDGAREDDVLIVTPSDHIVQDPRAFATALDVAVRAARQGRMTTLGIVPVRPETGFGYIRPGRDMGEWREVEAFVEKPDLATAERYVAEGHLWNGGVFVSRFAQLEEELARLAPELWAMAQSGRLREELEGIAPVSFDRAIMEHARSVAVVPLDAGWSDVGSWDALHDVLPRDGQDNATLGDVVLRGCSDCFVDSRDRLTVLDGVEGLIVVSSPDALFVGRRGASQQMRDVVRQLKDEGRREVGRAFEGSRPWGGWRILCEDPRHRVLRITVMPGRAIPMRTLRHRNEHWVVLKGTGRLTLSGDVRPIHEGEAASIPKDVPRELTNCGSIDLELVIVQEGEWLDEDGGA